MGTKLRSAAVARSGMTGRYIARAMLTGRFKTVDTGLRLPATKKGAKISLPAIERAIARRARAAAARAETTGAMQAVARGEVTNAGRSIKSVLAHLNAGD